MGRFTDISNKTFGRLLVLRRIANLPGGTTYLCRCSCGKEKGILAKNLVNGRSQSCGCVRDVELHGLRHLRAYRSWVSMKQRCLNPSATGYERYGGAGVKIHESWMKFSSFLADMGERPEGTSLDRVNNDKGYEPGNCAWATPKQQANNRRKRRSNRVPAN